MTDQRNMQSYGLTQTPFQQPVSASTTPISTINDSYQHYISLPVYHDEEEDDEEKNLNTLLKKHLLATPLIFAVLFGFMLLPYALPACKFGVIDINQLKWRELILGASGWSLAFLIRRPLSTIFWRLDNVKAPIGLILLLFSTGLVEEIFRLGWLYHISDDEKDLDKDHKFLTAYWLGVGWEAAEAIYFIIQNFVGVKWYRYNLDSRYTEERQEVEEIIGQPLTEVSAWWGVMWRTSWIMAHIGFSCWIAWNFWLVLPAAMIHGSLYVIWGHYLPECGIPATSYGTFMSTMSIFLIGLALFGQIY